MPEEPRDPLHKWKANVRKRSRLVKLVKCERCGKTGGKNFLGRHHEWAKGRPGQPPKVAAVLCKRCHMEVEGRVKEFVCEFCGERARGARKHNARCQARKIAKQTAWMERREHA